MQNPVLNRIFRAIQDTIKPYLEKDNKESDNANKILKEKLSCELFKLHVKCLDELCYDMAKEVNYYFEEGFKLGVLTGIECKASSLE